MSKKIPNIFIIRSILFFLLCTSFSLYAKEPTEIVIWKGDSHAAFTALVQYNNKLYCAFRNANNHVDFQGKDCGAIKIIRSADGEKWESFLTYREKGYDLRDPQLSVSPSGELMLLTEKVQYKEGHDVTRNTCVSFIREDGTYTPLKHINFEISKNCNWIWNVEWIDGVAYGFCYVPFFGMVRSLDGINYELVETINLNRNPSEASIAKMNKNEYLAVVRTDGVAYLGIYDVKKQNWNWKDCEEMIACPKIITIKRELLVVGRSYEEDLKTTLYRYNKSTKQLESLIRISGGKDCSYPGIAYNKKKLYISYYKGDVKKSDIYLTTMKW